MDVLEFAQSKRRIAFSINIPKNAVVGIVDSSFNPPNWAHAKLAQICRQTFPDCYILFMLATGNADKPTVPFNELQVRVDMMRVLAESQFVDDPKVGLALTTEARFFEKAEAVSAAIPQTRAAFAMGFDTLVRIADQRYYSEPLQKPLSKFFEKVEVVVLTRNEDVRSKTPSVGEASRQQANLQSNPILGAFAGRIHLYEATPETDQVSSSRARQSIAELHRCSPDAVAEYVQSHGIYGLSREN